MGVHFADLNNAALYKFADNLDDLTEKANAFKTAAGEFATLADTFGNAESGGKADQFKAMATAFKTAADKFKDVGIQLSIAMGNTILRDKADDFKSAAIAFANDAEQFESLALAVGNNTGLNNINTKFQNDTGSDKLAHKFKAAADKLHDAFSTFASNLDNATLTDLKTKAENFKTAIDTANTGFKTLADEFQEKANLIDVNSLTGNEQAKTAINKFKAAASHFGNSSNQDTAAAKLLVFAEQLHRISGA